MIASGKQRSRMRVRTPRQQLNNSTLSAEVNEDHFFMSFGIKKRRIYYNTRYTEEERKWAKEVRHTLKREKNIQINQKQTLLRYYYSSNLKMEECVSKLYHYWQWFNDPSIQNLTQDGRLLLRKGFVYSYGVSRHNHPFSVMNLGDMEFDKYPLKVFFQALNHVNNRVIQKGFIPGQIETYDYILDLQEKFLSLPITSLKEYIQTISNVYSMRMNKMFIINCTSFAKWLYTGVEQVLSEETAKKIKLFTKQEVDSGQLLQFFDPHILEVKYGGKRPNYDHEQQYLQLQEQENRRKLDLSQTEYYSVQQNDERFQDNEKDARQACCGPEECAIY